ncbi:Nucleolar protein 16 [Acropora cervicornis]|uniref:Nucleolar protein 16 n=1 Tax=Acropora cervicornis TaxID=6130 RepID=A0AAD9QBK5_ACRCE|nr:Nucleolar protein 16 [Acropora cervicornis]
MTGVRRKKAQRNKRVNTTKPGAKRKKKDKKLRVLNQTLQKHWNYKKSVRQNFKELGLASDPNTVVGFPGKKSAKQGEKTQEDQEMEVDKEPTPLIQEFEEMAANELKTERHIPPGEARVLWRFIQDHGDNYKGMAKDKRNYNQYTPKQLQRKCETFLKSKQDFSRYLENMA